MSFGAAQRLWQNGKMPARNDVDLPSHLDMAWPVLVAVRDAGHALGNKEIEDAVADTLKLTDTQRTRPKSADGRGTRTLLNYRLAWSRTLLKNMGAIENLRTAEWSVTERGLSVTEEDIRGFTKRMYETLGERANAEKTALQSGG